VKTTLILTCLDLISKTLQVYRIFPRSRDLKLARKKAFSFSNIERGKLIGSLVILILGDPGAVSGGGEKSKRARKKSGRRKVKKEIFFA